MNYGGKNMSENRPDSQFRYYAFISYSRKDERIARWLQKKLESYRLPAVLQKQYDHVPQKMRVFRDRTDISCGGSVEEALSQELRASRKLIVISSPHSASSEYVEYEIASFLKLGRSTADILPFIVDGEIDASNPERDCYTPTLHRLNMNGADAVREGRSTAFVRLLASLLEIKYDDIKKREQMRRNRKIALLSAAATLLLCLAVALLRFSVPHTEYYADYATCRGIPKGIGRLGMAQVAARAEHYEITYQFNKPMKLMRANSARVPYDNNDVLEKQNRPKIAEYTYQNKYSLSADIRKWNLREAVYTYNSNDMVDGLREYKVLLAYSGNDADSDSSVIDFYYATGDRLPKSLSNNFLSPASMFYSDASQIIVDNDIFELTHYSPELSFLEQTSAIFRFKVAYDKNGNDASVRFFNANNQPASDSNGIGGYHCDYDDYGRPLKVYFDYDEIMVDQVGAVEYGYDDGGRLVDVKYVGRDTDDKGNVAVMNKFRLFAEKKLSYDGTGNVQSVRWLDAAEKPVYAEPLQCAAISIRYDKRGFELEERYELENGTSSHKEGITRSVCTCSPHGLPADVKQYMGESCVMETKTTYDADDRDTENLILGGDGAQIQRYVTEYSLKEGNTVEKLSVYKADNTLQNTKYSYYDKYGRHVEDRLEAEGNKPLTGKIDYKGNNRSISFLLDDKNLGVVWAGYARAEFTYDNNGNLVFAVFRNAAGELTDNNLFGFAKYQAAYSPKGLKLEARYSGADDRPVAPRRYGFATYKAVNDMNDSHLLSGGYFDANGSRVMRKGVSWSYFRTTESPDSGYLMSYYDLQNKLTQEKKYRDDALVGVSLLNYDADGSYLQYQVDGNGLFIDSCYFDRNGKKKYRPGKDYAELKIDYSAGVMVSSTEYDPDSQVVNTSWYRAEGSTEKYVKYERDRSYTESLYTADRKIISLKSYSPSSVLLSESEFRYHDDGSYEMVSEDKKDDTHTTIYHGKDGKLRNNEEGYAVKGEAFDFAGKKRTLYHDQNKSLVYSLSGRIIKVGKLAEAPAGDRDAVLKGDIVIDYGDYHYFANSPESALADAWEKGKKDPVKVALYRPSDKKIRRFEFNASVKNPIQGLECPFAADTQDATLAYVADIKAAYTDDTSGQKYQLEGSVKK
jgi:hypothetical protein